MRDYRYRYLLALLPLLLSALACQAVNRLVFPETPTALPTMTPPVPTTPASSPTPSLPPVSAGLTQPAIKTAHPTGAPSSTPASTPTVPVTPSAAQLRIFDALWKTVEENYLYPDFNGVDWNAIYTEYRQKVQAGLADADFYRTMDEMISSLGDEHSYYLSPEEVATEEAEFAGENDYVGIGVVTNTVEERDRVTVLVVFQDSPAEEAGIQIHDSLLAADGQPIVDETGFRRDLLRGPEGTQVEVTVQTPGKEPRQVTITRRRIQGALPVPHTVLTSPAGKRIGYILLISFADETVSDQVGEALKAMTGEAPLDGLILDNRPNYGGADIVAKDTLRYFINGLTGHFVSRSGERPFRVRGYNIGGSRHVPMVVLVGPDTVSFGELFSGILKDFGRAFVIGETTEGNVELLWGFDFEDGSRAWIAHEYFQPINNPDDKWEETGIVPDLSIPSEWDLVTLETDPAVLAALDHFDRDE